MTPAAAAHAAIFFDDGRGLLSPLTDLRAEQIDQRSLIISVVAMIFLPLTFLTGLLGMNVQGIPYADQPWAFEGVVWVCTGIAVAIAGYFIRRRWLR